jgi:hypothetical protein
MRRDAVLSGATRADKRVNPALLFRDLGITLDHPDSLAALAELMSPA